MAPTEQQDQFQSLVEAHKKIVYKVCNAYCRNRDDRDDLAQDIIIQLWRSFGAFDARYQFSTWMYRVALNVAISYRRSEHVRTRHLAPCPEHLLEVVDQAEPPSEGLGLLHAYIDGLDPLNKALVLLYLDGNSHQETAEVLGISATNVATKLNRLKQAMKQEFSPNPRAASVQAPASQIEERGPWILNN